MRATIIIIMLGLVLCSAGMAGDWPTPTVKMGSVELIAPIGDDPATRPTIVRFFNLSGDDWLWVANSGQSKFFKPSAVSISSKYRPIVKAKDDGTFTITFEDK